MCCRAVEILPRRAGTEEEKTRKLVLDTSGLWCHQSLVSLYISQKNYVRTHKFRGHYKNTEILCEQPVLVVIGKLVLYSYRTLLFSLLSPFSTTQKTRQIALGHEVKVKNLFKPEETFLL